MPLPNWNCNEEWYSAWGWITHIFQNVNNMYNWVMSSAETWRVVICDEEQYSAWGWIVHIFWNLNNMYNQVMSFAETWRVVIWGVCFGRRLYILYDCDVKCFVNWMELWYEVFVLVEGAKLYMNATSIVLWGVTICWITRHPFNFYDKLLNLSIYSFLVSQGVHMLDSRIAIRSKY